MLESMPVVFWFFCVCRHFVSSTCDFFKCCLWQWEKLQMTASERRKIVCSVTFHVIAITCVVWSLYVLIDRTADEIKRGQQNLRHTHTHTPMHSCNTAVGCSVVLNVIHSSTVYIIYITVVVRTEY